MSRQYCSEGLLAGCPSWAPRLFGRVTRRSVGRLVRNIPPRQGPSGLASPSGRRMSGVWRLDLLLGDLRRYHSPVAEGEAPRSGTEGGPAWQDAAGDTLAGVEVWVPASLTAASCSLCGF